MKNFSKDESEEEKADKVINDEIKPELRKHFEINSNFRVNEAKGGYRITDYLTYNSLVSDATLSILNEYSGSMQRHWKCSTCFKDFVFNLLFFVIYCSISLVYWLVIINKARGIFWVTQTTYAWLHIIRYNKRWNIFNDCIFLSSTFNHY